ncbi:mitochondrial import receptor subunit Tom40p [[Candida] jaroonii]|uniref:Mitochondrial import receptor subunit Tom40p n=1 Tax=[Candida] jaroonii TaxID=467808 RepID=A0ACA9Y1V7_9ASCO|nr:mitochondrial import receptor subunit Tom40p [[Candida] jaroonii]
MSDSNSTPVPLTDMTKLSIPTLPNAVSEPPKSNPFFQYLNDVYTTISEHRSNLNLENPGTIENLNKEVSRDVFLNQYFFTGLKADLSKVFSMSPAFQTSHSLSMGSQVLPPYAFGAVYFGDKIFMQGNIDNDLSFSGRANYGWDKNNVSKLTLQLVNNQPAMVQLEQDYQSSDFSVNFKTLNPSILNNEFTGVAVASLLQSLTRKLSVGIETTYSKQPNSPVPESAISYYTRYNNGNWIFSSQLLAQGALVASFWRKVSERVEAGIETQITASVKPITDNLMGTPIGFEPVIEGETTLGAKYEYRQSVFRGQIDSKGKVGVFMEKRVLPTVSILFSGEIDHFKQNSRLGVGLQFESAGDEKIMMMQQGLVDANGNPVPGAPQVN